jgi:Fe-Mn family superoxide dismutase
MQSPAVEAREPVISARTPEGQRGKHHLGYVDDLNKLVSGTAFASQTLEQIIKARAGDASQVPSYNNAAQAWSHWFHWRSLQPAGTGGRPPPVLEALIVASFGDVGALKRALTAPMRALLAIDVWEHAYYREAQNRSAAHLRGVLDGL